jgi:hypothetical protein
LTQALIVKSIGAFFLALFFFIQPFQEIDRPQSLPMGFRYLHHHQPSGSADSAHLTNSGASFAVIIYA